MTQADRRAALQDAFKPPTFKSRFKLQGMIAAVLLMWLDFAYIYHGLVSGDSSTVAAGMVVMFGAAAMAYFFG